MCVYLYVYVYGLCLYYACKCTCIICAIYIYTYTHINVYIYICICVCLLWGLVCWNVLHGIRFQNKITAWLFCKVLHLIFEVKAVVGHGEPHPFDKRHRPQRKDSSAHVGDWGVYCRVLCNDLIDVNRYMVQRPLFRRATVNAWKFHR